MDFIDEKFGENDDRLFSETGIYGRTDRDPRDGTVNMSLSELSVYLMVMIFSLIQFILIVRYFGRLQLYFNRLQAEIKKKIQEENGGFDIPDNEF